ncbi:MAG: lysine biosynthesis protein LysX [Candidatus Ranarchaeia archaeon]
MKIGLLVDRVRLDEKWILSAAKKLGVTMETVDAKGGSLSVNTPPHHLDGFDIFINRCVSQIRGLNWGMLLESYGHRVVNTYAVSLTCSNKLATTLALVKAGVPTPETRVAFDIPTAMDALEELGYPSIIKPVMGSWGRLVSILKDPQSAKAIIEHRLEMGPFYMPLYLQEYVDKPGRDIRAFVVGNNLVTAIYRIGPSGEWRTNTAGGGRAEICPLTDELREICIKATEAVGQGVYGVDVLESSRGLLINELNHTTEYRNTVPLTKVDIPKYMIEYAISLVKK